MNHFRIKRLTHTSGSSLLEVMIAMLVFSVGLIGVAALMLTSMRNNDATLARTNSTMLANEMFENMLANLPGTIAGDYDLAMNAAIPRTSGLNCGPYRDEFGIDPHDCDTEQLATWELGRWGKRFGDVLHYGDASIAVKTVDVNGNPVDPAIIEITVKYLGLMDVAAISDETKTEETFTFRARSR